MAPRRISRGRWRSRSSTKVYRWADLWHSAVFCSFLCMIASLQSVAAQNNAASDECSSMTLPNGMVPASQNGEAPQLQCDPGYRNSDFYLNHEVPYICTDGVLVGNLTCKRVFCLEMKVTHGKWNESQNGTHARLQCDPGYRPSSSPDTSYLCSDGTLMNGNQTCETKNCSSMTLENGILTESVDGASPEILCNHGYLPNDITETPYRCISGKLTGNQTCIMGICSSLQIANGLVPKSLSGTFSTLQCDLGYMPNMTNSRTVPYYCNNGTLQGNQTCGIIDDYCREQPDANGKIAPGNYSLGSTASLSCNIGFQLSTRAQKVCAAGDETDGIWSGDQHCRAIDFHCPPLVVDGAGTLYLGFRRVGSRAVIFCNSSSVFVPAVRPICTVAGNGTVYWKDVPTCDVTGSSPTPGAGEPVDGGSSLSSGSLAAIATLCFIIIVLGAFLVYREHHLVAITMNNNKSMATINNESSLHKIRHRGEELCDSLKNSVWHAVSSKKVEVPDAQVWVSQDSKLNEVPPDHGKYKNQHDLSDSDKLQRCLSAPSMFSTDLGVSAVDRTKQMKQAFNRKRCHTSALLLTEKERQSIAIEKDLVTPCSVEKQSSRRVSGTSEQSGEVAMIQAVTSEEEAAMKCNSVPVTPTFPPKERAMTDSPTAPLLFSPVAMLKTISTWRKDKKEKDANSKNMNPWSGVNRRVSKNITDTSRAQTFRSKLTLPRLKGDRQRSQSENPTTKAAVNSVEMSPSQDLYECLGENQRPAGPAGTGPETQEAGEGTGELYECLRENQKGNGQPSSKKELPANTKKVVARRESMTDVPEAFRDVLHYGGLGDLGDVGSIYNNSICSNETDALNGKQSSHSLSKRGAVKSSGSKTKEPPGIPCLVDPMGFSKLPDSSFSCSRESLYMAAVDIAAPQTLSASSSTLDLPSSVILSSPAPPSPLAPEVSDGEPTNGVESDAERESVYAACSGTEVGGLDSFTDLAMVKQGGSRHCSNPLPLPPSEPSMEESTYEMDDEVLKQVVKDSRSKGNFNVQAESSNKAASSPTSRKLKNAKNKSKIFSRNSSNGVIQPSTSSDSNSADALPQPVKPPSPSADSKLARLKRKMTAGKIKDVTKGGSTSQVRRQSPSVKPEPNAAEEDVYEAL